jgi:hypothetical protein
MHHQRLSCAIAALAIVATTLAAAAQNIPAERLPAGPEGDSKACNGDSTLGTLGQAPKTNGEVAPPLSDRLAKSEGVLCPPGGIDPQITVPPPEGGRTPVIPPPGSPGGDPTVRPK